MATSYRTRDLSRLTVDDIRRILSGRSSRKLAHNTWAELDDDGSVGIRFHATRILEFQPDGRFAVDTGGWRTVTTKQRLNALLPAGYRVHAERFAWKMTTPEGVFDLEDGDRFGQVAPVPDAPTGRRWVVEYEPDPDLSYLDQPEFADCDPADYVSVWMRLETRCECCGTWQTAESLGGIDFLETSSEWTTGTFDSIDELPKGYLRDVAADLLAESVS
jgi:hypothetical protein